MPEERAFPSVTFFPAMDPRHKGTSNEELAVKLTRKPSFVACHCGYRQQEVPLFQLPASEALASSRHEQGQNNAMSLPCLLSTS
ncbi:hypothetical protein O181_092445 [Austropuccinia psidii MF-1]|uniref:Uncharacterized protein n=1 Tax=Austropuccinia psidii MF-1 TaxID=1389203 RepID=A0A9Q3IZQ3_9BASI|nr:hypothetical protein [Austropuccinia psidii MF-1]